MEQLGGRGPAEVAEDSGFAYYTRFFAAPDGRLPAPNGWVRKVAADGTVSVLTIPADAGAWSVTFVVAAADRPMRQLRTVDTWMAAARAIPDVAPWADGTPTTDVMPMFGLEDRRRRYVVDGRPVATGLVAVADAWACTNPTLARGLGLGAWHAARLRDAVGAHLDDPVELAMAWDRITEEELVPWFEDTVRTDRATLGAITAAAHGAAPGPIDPARQPRAAFFAAWRVDPVIFRAFLEVVSALELPEQVLAGAALLDRVVAAYPVAAELPAAGPSRGAFLAALS